MRVKEIGCVKTIKFFLERKMGKTLIFCYPLTTRVVRNINGGNDNAL